MKIIELKEKLDELKLIENQNEEEKEFLLNKIKKYCNILTNGKFDKKYIDTEAIIEEEDKTEDYSRSLIFNNNNDSSIKRCDTFNNIEEKNLLTFNRDIRRNKTHINQNKNLENLISNNNTNNWNVKLNVNNNVNYQNHSYNENEKNDLNNIIKENKEENESTGRKNSKYNLYKKIPPLQINSINLNMDNNGN